MGASAATAQVRFDGEARFGVTYEDSRGTDLDTRFQFDTTAETTTDSGLTFGAQVRTRAGAGHSAAPNGPRFFVTTGDPRRPPRR